MNRLFCLLVLGFYFKSTILCAHEHKPQNHLGFVENKGQWDDQVLFRANMPGGVVFLEKDRFTYLLINQEDREKLHDYPRWTKEEQKAFVIHAHAYSMRFKNASEHVFTKGDMAGTEYYNFFIGNDPSKWAHEVLRYEKVIYQGVYPNIDLQVMFDGQGQFKYDWIIHAGGNPQLISMEYQGLDRIHKNKESLQLETSIASIQEAIPLTYQRHGQDQITIPCQFLLNENTVQFSLPQGYQKNKDLVIDPVLVGATLSGTVNNDNYGHCATYDDAGNIYTGARSFGPGYPTTLGVVQLNFAGGGTDIAISKLSPDATNLIYATYLGGNDAEYPHSLICHDQELIVMGSTSSNNYPVSALAYDNSYNGAVDFCITRLNATGTSIVGSTFVGGSNDDAYNAAAYNYGDGFRGEVITDNAGNVVVVGASSSANFPVVSSNIQASIAGGQDGVAFKLSPNLSAMIWSTYIGGSANNDIATGIRIVSSGEIFVTGSIGAQGFAGTGYQTNFQGGPHDGFVMKLSSNASAILASTYIGTVGVDLSFFIDIDNLGKPIIYGQHPAFGGPPQTTLPVLPAGTYSQAGSKQFIARLTSDLISLDLNTLIGGNYLVPVAFMVDKCGYIYFSGYSASSGLPLGANPLFNDGGFYLGVLEPDATALNYATYYTENHVDGGTSRFDKNGKVYQGVCSGGNFSTTPGAWAPNQSTGWDIGVFKIDFEVPSLKAEANALPKATGCAPLTVDFQNTGQGGLYYFWDFGDGSPLVLNPAPQHIFVNPGVYEVMLIAIDSAACVIADTSYITITIGQPIPPIADIQVSPDCEVPEIFVNGTTDPWNHYTWDMGDGTVLQDNGLHFEHVYPNFGVYEIFFTVTDTLCNLTTKDSLTIDLKFLPPFELGSKVYLCPEDTVIFTSGVPTATHLWSNGSVNDSIWVWQTGTYVLEISDGICQRSDTVSVELVPVLNLAVTYEQCYLGEYIQLHANHEGVSYWWSTGEISKNIVVNEPGNYTLKLQDKYGCLWQDTIKLIEAKSSADVYFPNTFTPDRDGLNDIFKPETIGIKEFKMSVFNRWGQEIFYSEDINKGWDGSHQGIASELGVYTYMTEFKNYCTLEKKQVRRGLVTLLR